MIIRKYKCLLFEKKLTVTTHSIKVAEWKRSLHDRSKPALGESTTAIVSSNFGGFIQQLQQKF